jgi:23S rRNA pseudouridine2457 synthase
MLGELAQLSCVHEYEKNYWVMVEGEPSPEKLMQLEQGIQRTDDQTQPAKARLMSDRNVPPRSKL